MPWYVWTVIVYVVINTLNYMIIRGADKRMR